MPDCYLCGDYIARGRGYRREVQVESSTRVYISRRIGGSYGTRTALRTLCRRCAKVEDHVASGKWFRQVCYVAGAGLSIWFGWHTIRHGEGNAIWFGLFFLLGLPVPLVAWLVEAMCRSNAEGQAGGRLSSLDLAGDGESSGCRQERRLGWTGPAVAHARVSKVKTRFMPISTWPVRSGRETR